MWDNVDLLLLLHTFASSCELAAISVRMENAVSLQ